MQRAFGVRPLFLLYVTICSSLLGVTAAEAQHCQMLVPGAPLTHFLTSPVTHPRLATCACTQGCQVGYRCYKPELGGVDFSIVGSCDPTSTTCAIVARVPMIFPGRAQDPSGSGGGPKIEVREGSTLVSTCGAGVGIEINVDEGVLTLEHNFTCQAPPTERTFEVKAIACANTSGCSKPSDTVTVTFSDTLLRAQFCEPRLDYPCATQACNACVGGRGGSPDGPKSSAPAGATGASAAVGGNGAGTTPPGQPGAVLTYFAGGVGALGTPGASAWRAQLGRYWAHEFAERIVVDPDESHVWLLTRGAYFVEFDDLASGTGLQPYTTVAPSDEYRTLYFDNDTGGWVLSDLDGDLFFYDSQGRWYRSEDRNGNAWVGTLDGSGRVSSVAFPDGQSETLAYDAAGRLATITRVGVGGSPTRVWSYEWAGPDLIRIRYPDGRARRFEYRAEKGFMTHQVLEGLNGTLRYEQAWAYDDHGNVERAWQGAASFTDAAAVEKWELAYDDPELPTETTVTDPLGGTSVYEVGRDAVSRKPKVLSISGACPVCGSAPDTTFVFDSTHPLRVAMATSPGGTRTDFDYDAFGQVTRRTDAATASGHPHLPRVTEWEFDTVFPALVTRIEGPTKVGETATRITTMSYDGSTGDLLSRTISGEEATYSGGGFSLTTTYADYDAAGGVGTIDPPGYGSSDQTLWTYDVAGRNGMLADSRTDPLVGTWTFGYDAFNRRTTVTDPNGVTTTTAYDALDRVTSVTQGGDPGTTADDRVTTYTYNRLGDLYCVKSPGGSGTEYLYDSAGRLTELRRGMAAGTPSATSCLTISSSNIAERQLYVLDGAGHRVSQKLDRGISTTSWTNQSETSWVYGSMCHLDQTIEKIDATTSAVTEYAYDCEGNLERVWDPLHPRASYPTQPSTTYAYDDLDRLVSVTQPWGGAGGGTVTTSYAYDVQDHLVRVVDGEGTETLYEYSDRDLMTAQESEVSGVTTYGYNEHGELVEETDARLVTVARTVDAADRVTLVEYPDSSLDVSYTYGTSATGWQKGRLLSIARDGQSVDFTYNAFGEVLSENGLVYTYDKNGNRLTTTYPGNLLATYAYDKMDRPLWLQLKEGTSAAFYVVRNSPVATYRAFGPLASLRFDLGTDRDETRGYDFRYAPTSIAVSGNLFNWAYTTDLAGNVTAIEQTLPTPTVSRTYGYQEWQSYLSCAAGPWNLAAASCNPATNDPIQWTYDKVGNRLSEARDGTTDSYAYQQNAATTGNMATLDQVTLGIGGTREYSFDAAGYLELVDLGANEIDFGFDEAGTLGTIARAVASESLSLAYDGRGFLRQADDAATGGWLKPLYSSDGRLMSLERLPTSAGTTERINVLYFAGRPVAIWKKVGTSTATWNPIVTDHLGTPVYALTQAGAQHWLGGFEPFGRDHQQGTAQDSLTKGIFLRLPGQWDDALLNGATLGADVYYNVHRWYETGTGRFASKDPLLSMTLRPVRELDGDYLHARSSPTREVPSEGV